MAGRYDVLRNDSDIEIDMNNVLESVENLKEETLGKVGGKMGRKRVAQDNRKTAQKTQKITPSNEEVVTNETQSNVLPIKILKYGKNDIGPYKAIISKRLDANHCAS